MNRVVFVLGAGASAPFGLPTGAMLRDALISSPPPFTYNGLELIDPNDFSNRLREFAGGTIDRFLANNATFVHYGKGAIARQLGRSEIALVADRKLGTDWMSTIFPRFPADPRKAIDGRCHFITFNYDMMLESTFCQWARNFGGRSMLFHDNLSAFPITHVHGSLVGVFNMHKADPAKANSLMQVVNGSEFLNEFVEIGRTIRIIGEPASAGESSIEDARNVIRNAERIIFLGFGFDETNIELLGASGIAADKNRVFASAFGLQRSERRAIVDRLGANVTLGTSEHGCDVFLRDACMDWLPGCLK